MTRKSYFTKCFACWAGYAKCKKEKISRRQKKKLKKFLLTVSPFLKIEMFGESTSCNLSSDYKRYKHLFHLINIVLKYKKAFDVFKNYYEDCCESIYIDNNGRLSWYWEDDNGLYCYDGLMPFCYSEKEAGKTWAFSEVKSLVEYHIDDDRFSYHSEINSDLDLLKFLNKKSEVKNG